MPIRYEREKHEKQLAEDIVSEVEDDGIKLEEEIEEVVRIGNYTEGEQRLMKIRFRSQTKAEDILAKSWKLVNKEEFKNVKKRKT